MKGPITKEAELVIRSREELEKLVKKESGFFRMPKRVEVSLEFLGIAKAARTRYEQQLSKLYSECGCSWGTIAGIGALAAYIAVFVVLGLQFAWFVIPTAIFLFSVSVVAGKIAGLAIARLKLRWLVMEILNSERPWSSYESLGNTI